MTQGNLFAGHDFSADQTRHLVCQAAKVHKFQQGGLLNGGDRLLRIADAGQFHQDPIPTLHLHRGFGQTEGVDPPRYIVRRFTQFLWREVFRRDIRLQQDAQAADQVQTQALRDVQDEFGDAIAVGVDFQVFAAFQLIQLAFGRGGASLSLHTLELGGRGNPDAKQSQYQYKNQPAGVSAHPGPPSSAPCACDAAGWIGRPPRPKPAL